MMMMMMLIMMIRMMMMMMMRTHRAVPTADKNFVFLNLAKDVEAWEVPLVL